MKTQIVISISYAGMMLPVYRNEAGQDVTPLKPIVTDMLGIQWENQRKKVTESEFLRRELGVCTPDIRGADPQKREWTCIRLDRVAYFLMTINPDRVRSHGNISGAEYLEQKISEWADALHDYEELGIAINLNHAKAQEALRKARVSFAQMMGVKNKTAEMGDRRALSHMLKQMAGELDVPYQLDLLDGEGGK